VADENVWARSQGSDQSASLAPAARLDSAVSAEDAVAFQSRFLGLLERQASIYTIGDSTSVPAHVAADLLRSVCFVLGIDLERAEVPERLLAIDLEGEFRRNLAEIGRKVHLSGQLWRDACASMPPIPNTALHDTLASIGDFPKLYDYRSMAHEIPCVFDYPICHPVADSLLGVDYINDYLGRLLVEFDFLGRFEVGCCVRVLERSSPDYVDLLVNLYEPVATNAIGRALLGADPRPLLMADEERTDVARLLGPLRESGRNRALCDAALTACEVLGVTDEPARRYLLALVPELLPRIDVALRRDELRGVFV
jgi:hypothetical protein